MFAPFNMTADHWSGRFVAWQVLPSWPGTRHLAPKNCSSKTSVILFCQERRAGTYNIFSSEVYTDASTGVQKFDRLPFYFQRQFIKNKSLPSCFGRIKVGVRVASWRYPSLWLTGTGLSAVRSPSLAIWRCGNMCHPHAATSCRETSLWRMSVCFM